MGDRPKPSFTERAESSTTRRETRQTDETSQERFQRVRIENTQNYGIYRENRRANETTEERDRRLDEEIERLRQKLEAAKDTPEQHPAIAFAFQTDYIFREKNARGLGRIDFSEYNEDQIRQYTEICSEAASFVQTEEPTRDLDKLTHIITEERNFRHTIIHDLNDLPPNRASDDWKEFRMEKFDNIVSRYKLDTKECRMLMVADIMQYEINNRCTIEQLNSSEYKTIVRIILKEWKEWKRKKNSSQS